MSLVLRPGRSRWTAARRWMLVIGLCALACQERGRDRSRGPSAPDGLPDLTRSQSIEGTFDYESITIPAEITIRATGDLTLNSRGPVEVAGRLSGDCVAITVNGGAALTVTGRVTNTCATQPADVDPPPLALSANGEVVFDGALIQTSGEFVVKNDPTLTEADFPEAGAAPVPAQTAGAFEIRNGSRFTAPRSARGGTEGDADRGGGNGRPGARFMLLSRGDLVVDSSTIEGQDGGRGGDHDHTAAGETNAKGGDGAEGGDVWLLAKGRVVLQGSTLVFSGDGGAGGVATAIATQGAGERAGSATAEGGHGGEAGLLRVEGDDGIVFDPASTVEIGGGGQGGMATAQGADGSSCADGHGQHGGHAVARGGRGAESPAEALRLRGDLTGEPIVTGGEGGHGGAASATGGNGGNGENREECENGGQGGSVEAQGGAGGDAGVRNLLDEVIGRGGDGGRATLAQGNGGDGSDRCDPPQASGDGGDGGNGSGGDGEPGTGARPGRTGGVIVQTVGNGGAGGDGSPAGQGGAAGADLIQPHGARQSEGTSFQDGPDGGPCPD